ncbi:uncharacterized protein LAJ45_10946 [Morchella importuna]|uniref:NAD(P)-binding protein n=1 Tax=Morchella conica CCBAS932 TaxID=1392247 RepID=A0A3N4KHM1_9PEZI|nr:uncharacterized protein LAJ45_10946 [Morchella importuna]KAH8145035.1 hypothetical protein LAJ45_10946 [Morchella importuna]RPB10056.1 NAD(P)-binding protein [Morchella conica CCBAS932]
MKAITIEKVEGKPGKVYYPLKLIDLPISTPKPTEVTVKLLAAALNHRDHFIRQHLYPGISFDSIPLLADGAGIVTSTGSAVPTSWLGKRVVLAPGRGWDSDPAGPESDVYAILGGTKHAPTGTLQEYISVPVSEVEEAPLHLDAVESAAIPLCGLTAFRAVFTKGQVQAGQNVLITGIGGGVALMALAFCCAKGAVVFVTSGSGDKLVAAKELGASAGVSYKSTAWEKDLKGLLPRSRPYLDVVIDGAGGDVAARTVPLLKRGGKIVSYGMTLAPQTPFTMSAVLKNIDLMGSTMGSRKEFGDMVEFVRDKQLRPVISKVADGISIDSLEPLFEDMKEGRQFGKLVVKIAPEDTAKL